MPGAGIIREIEALCPASLSLLSERRKTKPYGLKGGKPGKSGMDTLIRGKKKEKLPSKISMDIKKGDRLLIKTPGGGGFGRQ